MEILENIGLFFANLLNNFFLFFSLINVEFIFTETSVHSLTGLMPIIGYAIVFVSLLDFIFSLIPLQLQNPAWELQTIGNFIQHSLAFLIGLGFVLSRYYRDNSEDVRFYETVFLRFLRWLLLAMAILFLTATVLVFNNTHRVLRGFDLEISGKQTQRVAEIQRLEALISAETNPQQLVNLGRSLGLKSEDLTQPAPALKDILKRRLGESKINLGKEVTQAKDQRRLSAWKSAVKMILGLVIFSVTFILIWFHIGRAFG
ncbi:MAG: HpsJ family protein [Cyanobacteriota bacterium]|nr:HpsJ family protein [Cyanobacteriota bacterium]